MKKPTLESIEKLVNQLLKDCRTLNVPVTGAISIEDKLMGFDNKAHHDGENFNNIRKLVKSKGSISEFLCDVSHQDHAFSLHEEDKASMFTETNPQIFNTLH